MPYVVGVTGVEVVLDSPGAEAGRVPEYRPQDPGTPGAAADAPGRARSTGHGHAPPVNPGVLKVSAG